VEAERLDKRFQGYIFDLDGTVYLGEKLIPGAGETILTLRNMRKKVVFLSNKPLYTREDYAQKLTNMGIPTNATEVINSSYVMARYLSELSPRAKIYVIGEAPMLNELKRAGFQVTENPREIEYVVVAFDRTFNYDKLNIAFQAISQGAHFIATNPDRTCPCEDGQIPDCAGMIGAIEAVTGKDVETVVGKPSSITVDIILNVMGLSARDCLMIGDRLATDISMGKKNGISTALVLTGVTKPEDLRNLDIQPDYILESVRDLLQMGPD
jgi:arabinose operon protein AraL